LTYARRQKSKGRFGRFGRHGQQNATAAFQRIDDKKSADQSDGGTASAGTALGDPQDVAPFFRIPGFGRSPAVEDALAARGLAVFSTDVDAEDWLCRIKPAQIVERAMTRLNERGKGVLVLHGTPSHMDETSVRVQGEQRAFV
jgi:hypothetical protein